MKRGGGKNKGSSFEREIAKTLSLWISKGETDDIFWRSTTSGARATTRTKQGKQTANSYGDLSILDAAYSFVCKAVCFELKKGYSGTGILDILDGNKKVPDLISFWNQCETDRIAGDRHYSIVISKRDRKHTIITMSRLLYNKIIKKTGAGLYNRIIVDYQGHKLVVIKFQDFLDKVDPDIFCYAIQL